MKKKLLLISSFFLLLTNTSFSSDTISLPNSKVGLTFGLISDEILRRGFDDEPPNPLSPPPWGRPIPIENRNSPAGISWNIFYHFSMHRLFFVSLDMKYNLYENSLTRYDGNEWVAIKNRSSYYVSTIGLNWRAYSDKVYIGMHGGAQYWKDVGTYYSSPAFYFVGGMSYPFPKYHLSFEASASIGINHSGVYLGLAYLIP